MSFHEREFIQLFIVQVVLGVWALLLGWRHKPTGRWLGYALIIDEGLLLIESAAGALLFASGNRPEPIHFLYGGLLIGLLPIVYPLSQQKPLRSGYWLGLTLLFMAGLIVRASMTGRA